MKITPNILLIIICKNHYLVYYNTMFSFTETHSALVGRSSTLGVVYSESCGKSVELGVTVYRGAGACLGFL